MWDNRTTMHRVRRYADMTQVRDMRRTTIRGTHIDVEQIPVAQAAADCIARPIARERSLT